MQITCEKCQTSYAVDDSLIPAGGAPVQCTKCGNLFTAYPPAAQRPGGRTVMMFAAEVPGAAAPAPAPIPAATQPYGGTSPFSSAPPLAAPPRANSPAVPPAPAPRAAPPAPRASSPAMPAVRSSSPAMPAAAPPAPVLSSSPTIRAELAPNGELTGAPSPFGAPTSDPFGAPPVGTVPFGQAVAAPVATPAPRPAVIAAPVAGPAFEATVRSPVPQAPPPRAADPITEPLVPPPRVVAAAPAAPEAPPAPAPAPAPTPTGMSRPGKVTQMFFNQGEAVDRANQSAQLSVTGEANRKPGQTQMFMAAADLEEKLVRKSRTPLYLGLAALAIVALGAAALLILPQYLGPTGSDRQAVAQDKQALALIRQDDAASLAQADTLLEGLIKTHPKYVDPQAHRALVLEFRADDLQNQVRRLRESYEALDKQVAILNKRKEPADWMQRVNAAIEQMKQMQGKYNPLARQQEALGNQAFALAQAAYKADPGDAWAALALGFYYADHDDADKNALFVKKYQKLLGKKDGWAELALAELDATLPISAQKRADGIGHVTEALGRDPSLTRARYLRVAMDVGLKDEAAAKDDAAALAAANPKHEGGKGLVDYLEEGLARERTAKAEQAARAAEQAKQEAPVPAVARRKPAKKTRHR
ncbi:MAG: zinc-ribbon domain-containing protein [Myxococcales bacterium]